MIQIKYVYFIDVFVNLWKTLYILYEQCFFTISSSLTQDSIHFWYFFVKGKFVYVMHVLYLFLVSNSWMVLMYSKLYIYWLYAFFVFLISKLESCIHIFAEKFELYAPFYFWNLNHTIFSDETWICAIAFAFWSLSCKICFLVRLESCANKPCSLWRGLSCILYNLFWRDTWAV